MRVERRHRIRIGRFRVECAGWVSAEAPKFAVEVFARRYVLDVYLCCWRCKANIIVGC